MQKNMQNEYEHYSMSRSEFPFLLRQISSLPRTLDVVGELPPDDFKFLCIVGARRHSPYGRDACEALISGLQGYPVVIVSGLALGIDSIAHEAAIAAGLRTIAFPGSGLSPRVLYPAARRALAENIVASGGALVSPFRYDEPSAPWFFPARNRLMAGMCHATLIIEAREGSGTMITADAALEFGRDVFAVPGSIFSDMSRGSNALFSHGAAPVACSDDILVALGLKEHDTRSPIQASLLPASSPNKRSDNIDTATLPLSPTQRAIYDMLREAPRTATFLMEKLNLSAPAFSVAIAELELLGLIAERDGLFATSRSIV